MNYVCRLCGNFHYAESGMRPEGFFMQGSDKDYFFCNSCYYTVTRNEDGTFSYVPTDEVI